MKKNITTEDGGSYQIRKKIGSGGMADVFLAVDDSSGVHVAVKSLPPGAASREETVKRFKREGLTSLKLNHPHIVNIIALAIEETPPCFVMEFAPGGSLADKIRRHPDGMPEQEILRIARQILEALDYAHNSRIVHRDIKPENILFDRMDNVLVSDFGLARTLDEKTMTRQGALLGTPYYNSPELARGQKIYDGRCDLYSLGVMLFEMATGKLPFDGVDAISVCHRHVFEPPKPPRSIRETLSVELEKLILKALEKQAGERYQSAADMLSDLERVSSGGEIDYDPLPGVIALLNNKEADSDLHYFDDNHEPSLIERFFMGAPGSPPEPAAGLVIGAMIALVMWTGVTFLAGNRGIGEGALVKLATVSAMTENNRPLRTQRPDVRVPEIQNLQACAPTMTQNIQKRKLIVFPFEDRCKSPSRVRAVETGLAKGMSDAHTEIVPANRIFAWQKKTNTQFSSLFTKANLSKLGKDFQATHFITGAVLSANTKVMEIEFACYTFDGCKNLVNKRETIAVKTNDVHSIAEAVRDFAASEISLHRGV